MTTQQGALCSILLIKYHSGDKIMKTEIGRAYSTYGGEKVTFRVLIGKPE